MRRAKDLLYAQYPPIVPTDIDEDNLEDDLDKYAKAVVENLNKSGLAIKTLVDYLKDLEAALEKNGIDFNS